ncbi:hypothetical protein AB3G33_02575 [Flavobacterium sp. WC2421]|uniref:hypothetical protein n=1 Tax=Flavobacterium sp. WC2421 TaxID=3234138 RepID=UPI0034674F11
MAANLVVNWETFSKIEKDGFEIYEIEVSEKKASEIESNLFQNQLKYELIAIKKGTEIHSYLVEAYTSLNHTLFANSIENLSNFTGTLNVFQLDGTPVGQLVIFNGHSKNTTEKSVIEPLNEVINFYSYKQSLTNKAPECVETYIVYTYALENTNHYSSVTVGNYTQLTYRNTTQETIITTSFMNTPYPCGTNGDSYYILYRTTINRDVVDEIVDDVVFFIGPSNKISNINDYLKCFNLAQSAQLTIYVDQPTANSSVPWSGSLTDPNVGHTFIAIQQGGIRRVLGYYPNSTVSIAYPNDSKAFGNDQGHISDVSLSIPINSTQLLNVIGYANNAPSTYNLNTYNCTDFAIAIGNLVGLNLPDSYGTWTGGGGSNPGQLGQNIRNMSLPTNANRQTTGANSATNTGTCN